jgi:hypothetical protein
MVYNQFLVRMALTRKRASPLQTMRTREAGRSGVVPLWRELIMVGSVDP